MGLWYQMFCLPTHLFLKLLQKFGDYKATSFKTQYLINAPSYTQPIIFRNDIEDQCSLLLAKLIVRWMGKEYKNDNTYLGFLQERWGLGYSSLISMHLYLNLHTLLTQNPLCISQTIIIFNIILIYTKSIDAIDLYPW